MALPPLPQAEHAVYCHDQHLDLMEPKPIVELHPTDEQLRHVDIFFSN